MTTSISAARVVTPHAEYTDEGGFVAESDGAEPPNREAFWFAWSQFHPDTLPSPNDA
jgi:hypothetical protein